MLKTIQKLLLFSLCATLGCLITATIAHFVIDKIFPLPEPPSQAIVLLIDTSGSMLEEEKMENVKSAAITFSENLEEKNQVAVVGFGNEATVITTLTNDLNKIEQGIATLQGNGATQMDLGLEKAIEELKKRPKSSIPTILLFTDGEPTSAQKPELGQQVIDLTKENAETARNQGINIIAVATADANFSLLEEVTDNKEWVFSASKPTEIDQAFRQAEKVIKDLITLDATTAGKGAGVISLLRVSAWSALLALGASLGMIIAQNYYLHRTFLAPWQVIAGFAGSFTAGLIAGALGQIIYNIPVFTALGELGRILAWGILGCLLGIGMSFFIPNLKPLYALLGGMLGGAIGGLGFVIMAQSFGNVAGRIVGAGFVGLSFGCVIALVEAVFREAWLEVKYGPNEVRTVTLGVESISFGSNSNACTIYIPNVEPIACRFRLEKGQILYEEVPTGQLQRLTTGVKKNLGRVEVLVKGTEDTRKGNSASSRVVTLTSSADKFALNIQGQITPLGFGTRISGIKIPGLTPQTPDNIVAEVNSNPKNPSILGLKNLSMQSWSATTAIGDNRVIDPHRSLKIAIGTTINFGAVYGENLDAKQSVNQYAGFWKRFAAIFIDSMVLYPTTTFVTGVSYLKIVGNSEEPTNQQIFIVIIIYTFINTIIQWMYCSLMESSATQGTLGKMALGIIVTDLNGNRISFRQATGRYFAKSISNLLLGIGYLMVFFTKRKQGLHDIMAKCLVTNKNP